MSSESGLVSFFRSNFGGNREAVLKRDGYQCVKCGLTQEEHKGKYGRDITVDHIDGSGCSVPISQKNNALENLQTLCLECHGRKDNPNTYKTHCIHGHELTLDNIRNRRTRPGFRECKTCYRGYQKRLRERRKLSRL